MVWFLTSASIVMLLLGVLMALIGPGLLAVLWFGFSLTVLALASILHEIRNRARVQVR